MQKLLGKFIDGWVLGSPLCVCVSRYFFPRQFNRDRHISSENCNIAFGKMPNWNYNLAAAFFPHLTQRATLTNTEYSQIDQDKNIIFDFTSFVFRR